MLINNSKQINVISVISFTCSQTFPKHKFHLEDHSKNTCNIKIITEFEYLKRHTHLVVLELDSSETFVRSENAILK